MNLDTQRLKELFTPTEDTALDPILKKIMLALFLAALAFIGGSSLLDVLVS